MAKPAFTAEELAELALFDAQIDDEPLTMDELRESRERDRQAELERMDHKKRRIAEYQREYYAANKDAIAEYKREYRAANKDAIAERRREYRAANKDAIAEYKREYRAANKDAIAEYQRGYNLRYYYAERPKRDDIRLRRKEIGMSQAELARRVGVSASMICMIEMGRVNTRRNIMREIYRVLGMEGRCDNR